MSKHQIERMEIFRPVRPLEYPLEIKDVCEILTISKSTLLAWERNAIVPSPDREVFDSRYPRKYMPENLTQVLLAMKTMTFRTWNEGEKPKFPWLQNFDPSLPCEIVTPSHFIIKYEPIQNPQV